MARQIVVVENMADWKRHAAIDIEAVHADDYLTRQEYFRHRNIQVINLCRGYRYLSVGYYVSLLGQARGHRVLPAVETMLALSSKALYSLDAERLDRSVKKAFGQHAEGQEEVVLSVVFGRCRNSAFASLARQIFEQYPAPLIKAVFRHSDTWRLESLRALTLRQLDATDSEFFAETLEHYRRKRPRPQKSRPPVRYDMAILHDPKDPQPPSDERALRHFVKAGQQLGIEVEFITKRDYPRLAEYDALFIRDTTRIDHYTYRFARKAASEGMVVIDDPRSIQLCTNKVYLAELLRAKRIGAPKTVIVGRHDLEATADAIGFPMVLKVPDGSFSQGVFKVKDMEVLKATAARLFADSELLLAQEFLYTTFDWRVGVLNREPLYASQYFMSKEHWQIVQYDGKGGFKEGAFKTWPVEQVPPAVIDTALRAANLIGDGLYGVDLKQVGDKVYVIEVNDNPNLEAGVEDAYLKGELYRRIMAEFLRRLELRHIR